MTDETNPGAEAQRDALDHDGDGRKGGSVKTPAKPADSAKPPVVPTPPAVTETPAPTAPYLVAKSGALGRKGSFLDLNAGEAKDGLESGDLVVPTPDQLSLRVTARVAPGPESDPQPGA